MQNNEGAAVDADAQDVEEVIVGELESESEAVEADAQAEEAAEAPTIESLSAELQAALKQADENHDQMMRAKADADNQLRRARRDVENAHKYALEKFVNELLPVADSLEMGLAAAKTAGDEQTGVAEGIEMTINMFQTALTKMGVTTVNPEGEAFNAELHHAASMQPSADVAPNTVLAVFQKGYLLNERLLRPAMVVVSSAAGNSENNTEMGGNIDETA